MHKKTIANAAKEKLGKSQSSLKRSFEAAFELDLSHVETYDKNKTTK